jgi:glycosyltransferase involved in cell wall biosynthesis
MATISVIIPAYNQGHYLGEAIQSVIDQTYPDFELIVVDDGSTDKTAQVACSFLDPRVHYIHQENRGLSAARNTGILRSTGEYLTFLDSDDLFVADKLETLLNAMQRDPGLGFVAGQAVLIDENALPLGRIFDTPLPENPVHLLLWNPLHVCSVLLRRDWQEKAGLFDESLNAYEDWDMWLRLARVGCRMGWVPHPVSLYRFHTRQMTRDKDRMTTATFAVLNKVYSDPDLPEEWLALKDRAYSGAYLRAAIQAYRMGETQEGSEALDSAIRLDPSLLDKNGDVLANRFLGLADTPKVKDRLAFLEMVYDHLPDSLSILKNQRKQRLSQAAVELGFRSYQANDYIRARHFMWRAIQYRPQWLTNRGVAAVLVKSSIVPRRKTGLKIPKSITLS